MDALIHTVTMRYICNSLRRNRNRNRNSVLVTSAVSYSICPVTVLPSLYCRYCTAVIVLYWSIDVLAMKSTCYQSLLIPSKYKL